MTTIRSSFSANMDGWTISGDGSGSWDAAGGNSGGGLKGTDGVAGTIWYFEAPAKFEGDLSAFFDGALSFDLRRSSGSTIQEPDVMIEGANGVTLVLDTATPNTTWTSYNLALNATAGWRIGTTSGALATNGELQAVLADVARVAIRGEFVSGADQAWLDNVSLATQDETDVGSALSIVSTFESGLEGWTAIADVESISRSPTGGNPDAYLRVVDAATGELWHYSAPEEYLGNKAAFYGGTLSYDLKTSGPNEVDQRELVVSGGGLTMVKDFASAPTSAWTGYSVSLDVNGGWFLTSGAAATEAQIRQILGSLDELLIRGEFTSGEDEGGLDNVVLAAPGATGQAWRLFDGDALQGIYSELADALAAADAGDVLIFQNPGGDPVDAGDQVVTDNGLTVSADGPFEGLLAFSKGVASITLQGTNDIGVRGNAGGNDITGSSGNNGLLGLAGADTLSGGFGKDALRGGDGADTLLGGRGKDKLIGEDGADTFRFVAAVESRTGRSHDVIKDFVSADDTIDLSQLDSGTLTFISDAEFAGGGAHQVRVAPSGGDQLVQADLDGDGDADFEILVLNGGVTGGDFLL